MKFILSSDQAKFLEPRAELIRLNAQERLKISLKKFSVFFLLAIGSIFIPVFHFVLVPLFLLLSVIFGFKAYSTKYLLQIQNSCTCLQCGEKLKSEILLDEDLRFRCDQCSVHYLIESR